MSNKTPTPIQQAIEEIEKRWELISNPDLDGDTINRSLRIQYKTIIDYLKTLLPAERTFAEECFDAGFNRPDMDYISFSTFYKNNYEDGK